jgi:hypothetical protein
VMCFSRCSTSWIGLICTGRWLIRNSTAAHRFLPCIGGHPVEAACL